MLFISYWELNENMPEQERLQIAQKLTTSGLFPPQDGVKIVRWDATPDLWGVLIMEAENAADVFRAIGMWRAAGPGFFKTIKTAPALPIEEVIPVVAGVVQQLGGS